MKSTTVTADQQRAAAAQAARSPFRSPERKKLFAAMLSDYVQGNSALFHPGGRENRRNNIGEAFWRGVHAERYIWDVEAPLYVAYKAGAAIAKAKTSTDRA